VAQGIGPEFKPQYYKKKKKPPKTKKSKRVLILFKSTSSPWSNHLPTALDTVILGLIFSHVNFERTGSKPSDQMIVDKQSFGTLM
jgi:hypothetical protein